VVVVTPAFGDGDQLHRDVIERLDRSRTAPDAAGESSVEGGQVVGAIPPQRGSELSGVPELQCIFDHPTVRGALTSLVGEGYLLNPHHHIHLRLPGATDQGWHKCPHPHTQTTAATHRVLPFPSCGPRRCRALTDRALVRRDAYVFDHNIRQPRFSWIFALYCKSAGRQCSQSPSRSPQHRYVQIRSW